MSAQDKAANLFEYISKVYAIDLPVARIVTSYDDLFWRQADLIPCSHCRIKEFDRGNKSNETNETPEAVAEDAWLAVYNVIYVIPLLAIVIVFTKTMGARKLSESEGRVLKLISGFMMLGFALVLLLAPAALTNAMVSIGVLMLAVIASVVIAKVSAPRTA